jgi:hypothetical protein
MPSNSAAVSGGSRIVVVVAGLIDTTTGYAGFA